MLAASMACGQYESILLDVAGRACERSVSGAENGAERAAGMSGSGAERAKSDAQIRSHQHWVDLAI